MINPDLFVKSDTTAKDVKATVDSDKAAFITQLAKNLPTDVTILALVIPDIAAADLVTKPISAVAASNLGDTTATVTVT